MRNFKHCIAYLAAFALIFTSCSKEEAGVMNLDSEKATLSFGAIVTDLATRAASKQAVGDIPECSNDAPSYVEIVLMLGGNEVVGTADAPHRVNLAAGQVFTVEDPALELVPGNYTLDHFAVYNDDGDLIWVAPRAGSALGNYVTNALPLAIDLRAGVKKYVDVPVLCFDNREVNEYGYLFYELDTNVALEFCFFANYCTPDGRHYSANYSVNIWTGTNNQGTPLYSNVTNQTGYYQDTGDFYAAPLCFALPDNDDLDEEYLYYEVTLLDWEDNYGDVADGTVLSGTLSKRDITNNFGAGDEVEYEHLRFGCEDDGDGGNGGEVPVVDSDNDGIPDISDNCPNQAGPASNNGCPVASCDPTDPNADCDNDGTPNRCDSDNANYSTFDCDGDNVLNGVDNCPRVAGTVDNNGCPAVVVEPCLPDASEGCDTLSQTFNVTNSFEIFQPSVGDLTVEFTEEGMFVGITPVAPFELEAMEVTVNSTVVCASNIVADEGGSVIISGITAADLPLEVGVRVNYCNVLE